MDKEKVGKFYDMVWTEYIPEYKASEKHWQIFYSFDYKVRDEIFVVLSK